jgi:putative spermidine/putrescine transport system permease protein
MTRLFAARSCIPMAQAALAPAASSPDPMARDMVTADGVPLKTSLKRAERRRKITAFLLVAPLLAFILITFIIPIGQMMWRSVDNPVIVAVLPQTMETLSDWDGEDLPGEETYAALVADLAIAQENRSVGQLAIRLNYELSGARSLVAGLARGADELEAPFREAVIDDNRRWGE